MQRVLDGLRLGRSVPRSTRRGLESAGHVQTAQRLRRLLARRRAAADVAAHLRHGMAKAGAARPLPVADRGGAPARPPQTWPRARAVLLRRSRARPAVLATEGAAHHSRARGIAATRAGRTRLPGSQYAGPGQVRPVETKRP